jgi:hypothetical protein
LTRLLDLSPERGEALVDAALERREMTRLLEEALPLLSRVEPETRLLGEHILDAIARLAARVEILAQAQAEAALSRAERLRLDPLRAIPAARLAAASGAAPLPETGPVTLAPADEHFAGFGWWEAEPTAEGGSLRWSGRARSATLLLPALGGGPLQVTLSWRAPFGIPLDIAQHDVFLDGVPLHFETLSNDGVVGVFVARVTLPERPAGSRLTLLLHGAQHTDPATGPRRDTRHLGLGLLWARLERAD